MKLNQAGYSQMVSQHNIEVVPATNTLTTLDIPFMVGNPDLADHHMTFDITPLGINPYWQAVIVPDAGDPAPDLIPSGGTLLLHLQFIVASLLAPAPAPSDYDTGQVALVSIGVRLDGVLVSGFTVELPSYQIFFPLIKK